MFVYTLSCESSMSRHDVRVSGTRHCDASSLSSIILALNGSIAGSRATRVAGLAAQDWRFTTAATRTESPVAALPTNKH